MEKYIIMIAASSLVMSCVILGLILFNKLFAHKYSAKWRYYIWLVVLLGLFIPFRPDIKLPFQPIKVSLDDTEQPAMNDLAQTNNAVNYDYSLTVTNSSANTLTKTAAKSKALQPSAIIFFGWLAGVIITLVYYLRRHKKFTVMLKRWGTDVIDSRILSALEQERAELKIRQKIQLKKCKLITSPMLAGFIKPVILLPDTVIHEDELSLILKHELVHYKRKDLWVNLLVVLAAAVHWFNPIVHIMAAAIRNDCETSCDEVVLSNAGAEKRRIYCEAIIGFIGTKKAVKPTLSTNFYGGKNTMKKRIISIMDTGNKKAGIAILCAFLVLSTTFLSGFIFSASGTPTDTPDKALEIILARTGGGTVVKCELDYIGNADTGIRVYEIEVINGNTKYEVEIGVDDLKIYSFEESISTKDRSAALPAATDITAEKAVEIALAKTGGGETTKWELNGKGSHKVYRIEIVSETIKYTMDVRASDSEIMNYKEKEVNPDKINKTSQPTTNPILIEADEAKKIALDRAVSGKVEECELDLEKGVWIYEIEIKDGKTEYEADINAETGEILKFEIDD